METQGEWTFNLPMVNGYYWTQVPPTEEPSLVRIKDGCIHFLGTDDSFDEVLPEQLFWSVAIIPPSPPEFDAPRATKTREHALGQALEELDSAFCFSVAQFEAHPELKAERYELLGPISEERWEHSPIDYNLIGQLLIPLRDWAERSDAPRIVNAIDLYHVIQKGKSSTLQL